MQNKLDLKKLNVKILLLLAMALFSCNMKEEKENSSDYVTYVNKLVKAFSKSMKKDHSLVCYGSGGKMPYDVEKISIRFIAYQHATIQEARELEVMVTEKFVKAINSYEPIRKFLREYPFNVPRTDVAISFYKSDNTPYTDDSVAFVTQFNNKISYYSENASNGHLVLLKEEPYEEAFKIVTESSH